MNSINIPPTKEGKRGDNTVPPSFWLKKWVSLHLFVLLIGVFYAFVLHPSGFVLACPVRKKLNLFCGGCGVTGLCLALLRFQLGLAYDSNPFLFCSIPFSLYLWGKVSVCYIKSGNLNVESKLDNLFIYIYLILCVIWTVVRNL